MSSCLKEKEDLCNSLQDLNSFLTMYEPVKYKTCTSFFIHLVVIDRHEVKIDIFR